MHELEQAILLAASRFQACVQGERQATDFMHHSCPPECCYMSEEVRQVWNRLFHRYRRSVRVIIIEVDDRLGRSTRVLELVCCINIWFRLRIREVEDYLMRESITVWGVFPYLSNASKDPHDILIKVGPSEKAQENRVVGLNTVHDIPCCVSA